MSSSQQISIVSPVGYSKSTCGYCSPAGQRSKSKSSCSFGIWAHTLTPLTYQLLLDRGWRRSGNYTYKPDNAHTCCPHLTIRLDVDQFHMSKSHRKTMTSLQRYLSKDQASSSTAKVKGKYSSPFDLEGFWNSIESDGLTFQDPQQVEDEEMDESLIGNGESNPSNEVEAGSAEKRSTTLHNERHFNFLNHRRKLREEKGKMKAQETIPSNPNPNSTLSSTSNFHSNQSPSTFKSSSTSSTYLYSKPASPTLIPISKTNESFSKLKIQLSPSSSTNEKYQLFRKYQMTVHKESEEKVSSRKSWERFLVNGPMELSLPDDDDDDDEDEIDDGRFSSGKPVDINSRESIPLGQYHMEYRFGEEEKLIAVGVLDLLPNCLSSVYLFYDPDYEEMQLGKITALREILLVKQLSRKKGFENLKFYYMGYYIHSCQKMKYKASFSPSEILDFTTDEFLPFSECKEHLDKGINFDFKARTSSSTSNSNLKTPISNPSKDTKTEETSPSTEDDDEEEELSLPTPPPPGFLSPRQVLQNPNLLTNCRVLEAHKQREGLKFLIESDLMGDDGDEKERRKLLESLAALKELVYRFAFFV